MKKGQDMKALGAKGGKANIAKNGKARMAKIAVRGGLARWGRLKKAPVDKPT